MKLKKNFLFLAFLFCFLESAESELIMHNHGYITVAPYIHGFDNKKNNYPGYRSDFLTHVDFFKYKDLLDNIVPYGIKGVLWYQGESNASIVSDAYLYRFFLHDLICGWRSDWGMGDFPFLIVQLHSYNTMRATPS